MGVNPENGKFCSHVVSSNYPVLLLSMVLNFGCSRVMIFSIIEKMQSNAADATLIAVGSDCRHIENLDASDFLTN